MPFAPSIRKRILNTLSERIIPILENTCPLQLLLELPCDFRGVPHWTVQEAPLPDLAQKPLSIMAHWDEANMSMWRMSQLAFSYDGVSEEKIGLTQQAAAALQQQNIPVPCGVTALQVKAPAAFYVPSHTPRSGRYLSEYGGQYGIIVLNFTLQDCFIRHQDAVYGVSHSLQIDDARFKQMEIAYVDLLRKRAYDAASRQLLQLMQQLHGYLAQHIVSVSNSAWRDVDIEVPPNTSARTALLCHRAIDYIQFHLSDTLTLERLAQVCEVTPQHLSLTFSRAMGMPLMTYVTLRRLNAAEMMLALTNERITDVAQLSGFSSSHSFAVVFKRRHGISPRQYRERSATRR